MLERTSINNFAYDTALTGEKNPENADTDTLCRRIVNGGDEKGKRDMWRLLASSAFSAAFGIVFTAYTTNTLGAGIGIAVAVVFLITAHVTNDQSTSTQPTKSREHDSTPVRSMDDVSEEGIRRRLDHPDITVQNIDTDDAGAWFASVKFAGGKSNLRRVIGSEFDIRGKPMQADGETHARLIPNLQGGDAAIR